MKNLKFEKGIRKLLSKCDGGPKPLKLSNDGLDLLCGLCTDINARLIDDCKVEFRNQMAKPNVRGELNFTPFYVSNVIKRTFRRRLKEHALAEGEKGVMKYKNQLIDYDPRGALTPVKKSITDFHQLGKHQTEPDHMFMTKIGLLLNHVHHDLTMTSKARKHCSETLYTIVNKLIAKTAQVATGKVNVGTEDICEAMKYLLGEVMYEHAKNEGDNSIRMFRDGILYFKPVKRREHVQTVEKPSFNNVFCTGIKHLATDVHNGCPINNKGIKRTNVFITNVAQKLASAAVNHTVASGLTEVTPIQMQVALHKIMPLELCENAKTEGSRAVMLFKNDLIHFIPKPYKPRKPKSPRSRKIRARDTARHIRGTRQIKVPQRTSASVPKMPQPDFCKNLRELLSEINNMYSLNRKSSEIINIYLLGVCKKLIAYSVNLASKKADRTLTPEEIHKAVRHKVPGNMKDHAMANGDKELTCYTSGTTALKFSDTKVHSRTKLLAQMRAQAAAGRSENDAYNVESQQLARRSFGTRSKPNYENVRKESPDDEEKRLDTD